MASTPVEALAVANQLCAPGGHITHVLGTGSMYPTLAEEGFAVMKVDFSAIHEGDICGVKVSPALKAEYPPNLRAATLIHRVVHRWKMKDETAWETRGDNWVTNQTEDALPLVRDTYAGTAVCFVTWRGASRSYAAGMF
ncbi:MAG TPA: hypothetical protein VHE61_01385 [Opitutaceae bacterium]|nr:hypothetical protein [Opitutaceae bacterium]